MVTLANNQPQATCLTRGLPRRDTHDLQAVLEAVDFLHQVGNLLSDPVLGFQNRHT